MTVQETLVQDFPSPTNNSSDPLIVLLPLLIVLSTLLFLLLLFLVCILLLRKRRSIVLRDSDGPIDLSREEYLESDGGFEVIESRWLESVSELERTTYRRAQSTLLISLHLASPRLLTTFIPNAAFQTQYPPNSLPTDITLSQFLSIQEKGVSAWSFDPDYESSPNVLVHARTELTFLPDPSSASSVQSNLPLPKLNEVYYWEVKMFDLPPGTNVSIGLATKPYPSFRLPGHARHSVAYHSSGEKSYNYPFATVSYGPPLKEGDVLGIGYRPRTGSVFFTRNGRKMEDAFTGLNRFNLFPTVGADGPCSVHVNLGQAGFVHIEANVKKWGLAPSVGTLAPPPAYGSERGSILLEAGAGTPYANSLALPTPRPSPRPSRAPLEQGTSGAAGPLSRRTSRRSRHPATSVPPTPSPLRAELQSTPAEPEEQRQDQQDQQDQEQPQAQAHGVGMTSGGYISPTDAAYHEPTTDPRLPPPSPSSESDSSIDGADESGDENESRRNQEAARAALPQVSSPPDDDPEAPSDGPDSPPPHNPPTPRVSDIRLRTLNTHSRSSSVQQPRPHHHQQQSSGSSTHSRSNSTPANLANHPAAPTPLPAHLRPPTDNPPPAYSPLDAFAYPDGVAIDLPAEMIAAALADPAEQPQSQQQQGRRSRR
ncbi:Rsp5p-dependent ubiquitination, sorting of cargo proteins at the multivesicular body [Tulasnella sp. 417]|nr:Rsp5p-dependent ubiquitination, sorting of cargo proteins at the multivesicular body [Tulasnella sp. 417]